MKPHAIDTHGLFDVPEVSLAGILETDVERASCVFLHPARHADAPGFGHPLEPRRHVHGHAEAIPVVDNDVALVYRHSELDPHRRGRVRVAPGHAPLHLDGAA
jgi:hypothetical protein